MSSIFGGGGNASFASPANQGQINQSNTNLNTDIANQANTAQALGNNNAIANQNTLANQLNAQALGQGPNPAQNMLNQATGTNVSNQAALMASQRGTGSNAGLIARQAAQQGAGIQQQAAGQAATMGAQQQLNAQGQIAGLANQQIGQQLGAQSNATNAQQAQYGTQVGAMTANNAANSQLQQSQSSNLLGAIGGIGGAIATGGKSLLATGGEVKNMFSSELPDHLKVVASIYHPHMNGYNASTNQYARGGKVDALVSPGERFLKPEVVNKVAQGKADPIKDGEKIPGKPKVSGAVNSYANDTIPKKLDEGGIVIPRSITMGKNPGKEASDFVMAIITKKRKGAK